MGGEQDVPGCGRSPRPGVNMNAQLSWDWLGTALLFTGVLWQHKSLNTSGLLVCRDVPSYYQGIPALTEKAKFISYTERLRSAAGEEASPLRHNSTLLREATRGSSFFLIMLLACSFTTCECRAT